jgi:hypothetical protein
MGRAVYPAGNCLERDFSSNHCYFKKQENLTKFCDLFAACSDPSALSDATE